MPKQWWIVISEDAGQLQVCPSPLAGPVKKGDTVTWVNDTDESYTVGQFSQGFTFAPSSVQIGGNSSGSAKVTAAPLGTNDCNYTCGASSSISKVASASSSDPVNGVIIVDGPGTGDPKAAPENELVAVSGSRR